MPAIQRVIDTHSLVKMEKYFTNRKENLGNISFQAMNYMYG
jgi:hypothetical protein